MCTYHYIYICIYVYIMKNICAWLCRIKKKYVNRHVHIYIYTYIYLYMHCDIDIHICIYLYMYAYIPICINAFKYIYIYIYVFFCCCLTANQLRRSIPNQPRVNRLAGHNKIKRLYRERSKE